MKKYLLLIIPVLFFTYVIISPLFSEQLEIVKSSMEREANGQVYVKGVVFNKSSSSIDADLEVTFYDADHRVLTTTHLEMKAIARRSQSPFRTEGKNLPNAASYIIKASGGFRNPYGN